MKEEKLKRAVARRFMNEGHDSTVAKLKAEATVSLIQAAMIEAGLQFEYVKGKGRGRKVAGLPSPVQGRQLVLRSHQ